MRRPGALALVSAIAVSTVWCARPPASEPRPIPEYVATVSPPAIAGVVVDSITGLPLPQTPVFLRPDSDGTPASKAVAWAETDSLGRFLLQGVRPGRYALEVRRILYHTRRLWVDVADTTVLVASLALGRAICTIPEGDVCY